MLCDISMFTGNVVVAVGVGIYTPNTSWLSRNTVSNSSTYSSTSYEWVALHYTLKSEKRQWMIALKCKNFLINVVQCQQKPLKSKFLPQRDSVLVTKMIKNDRLNSDQHYDWEQNKIRSYATIAFSPMWRFLFETEQNGPLRKVSRITGMVRY